jgi:predicted transposase/invertase (TIGR01784 family)
MKEIEIQNPHDEFVRSVFSKPKIAKDFLANYLPSEIVGKLNLDSLKMTQESFVDEDLRLDHTVCCFGSSKKNGDTAFVYILLEHKNSPDKLVALRLLCYMMRIWEKQHEANTAKLPP